ncbi:hypothetical protein, partial [Ectopseudomonas chengduensis]|uniref:hypothetical protein n=1 Tax=Ectopseudomonas chengduensis TaxID=489632 RepID=UPI001AEFE7C6
QSALGQISIGRVGQFSISANTPFQKCQISPPSLPTRVRFSQPLPASVRRQKSEIRLTIYKNDV